METIKNDITFKNKISSLLPLFGVKSLRETQKDVIDSLLFEERDLLSVLPTGGGKTLCFQIASYFQNGITIIVYPLLSLMRDQKKRFESSFLKTVILQGGQTKDERNKIFDDIKSGNAKIIITNPETLSSKKVLECLKEVEISLFVIDEAHTVVEWGESFREAYKNLKKIIETLFPKKIAAFTATASTYVTNKLNEYVFFRSTPKIIRLSSNRENIIYHKVETLSRKESLKEILKACKYPVLIFTSTRNEAKNIACLLNEIQEHPVRYYHAGLTKEEKLDIEKWYYSSEDGILSSTCAFGMGVDKKNIRTVIHIKPPPTTSEFLQESGRAGRDGERANSYVIVKKSDLYSYNNKINECAKIFLESKENIRKSLLLSMGDDIANLKYNNMDDEINTMKPYENEIIEKVSINRGLYTKETLSFALKKDDFNIFTQTKVSFSSWSERTIKEAIETLINEKRIEVISKHLYPSSLHKSEQIVKNFTIWRNKTKLKVHSSLQSLFGYSQKLHS